MEIIHPYSGPTYKMSTERFNYALVVERDGKFIQYTDYFTCRELLSHIIGNIFFQTGTGFDRKLGKVDLKELKLLIVDTGATLGKYKRMKQIQSGINAMEDMAGFIKRSVVKKVYHTTQSSNRFMTGAWLIDGTDEWYDNPQMLSILSWFIRLAYFNGKSDFRTFEDVKGLIVRLHHENTLTRRKDYPHVADITIDCEYMWYSLRTFLVNHRILFGLPKKSYAAIEKCSRFYAYCGIRVFFQTLTGYLRYKASKEMLFNVAVYSIVAGQLKVDDVTKNMYKA